MPAVRRGSRPALPRPLLRTAAPLTIRRHRAASRLTCRASSVRPRLIRDLTVPSGSRSVSAISLRHLPDVAHQDGCPQFRAADSASRRSETRSRCSSGAGTGFARIGPARSRPRAVDGLALPHAAVVIDAEVGADTDEPGLKNWRGCRRMQRLENLQEMSGSGLALAVLPHEHAC